MPVAAAQASTSAWPVAAWESKVGVAGGAPAGDARPRQAVLSSARHSPANNRYNALLFITASAAPLGVGLSDSSLGICLAVSFAGLSADI